MSQRTESGSAAPIGGDAPSPGGAGACDGRDPALPTRTTRQRRHRRAARSQCLAKQRKLDGGLRLLLGDSSSAGFWSRCGCRAPRPERDRLQRRQLLRPESLRRAGEPPAGVFALHGRRVARAPEDYVARMRRARGTWLKSLPSLICVLGLARVRGAGYRHGGRVCCAAAVRTTRSGRPDCDRLDGRQGRQRPDAGRSDPSVPIRRDAGGGARRACRTRKRRRWLARNALRTRPGRGFRSCFVYVHPVVAEIAYPAGHTLTVYTPTASASRPATARSRATGQHRPANTRAGCCSATPDDGRCE